MKRKAGEGLLSFDRLRRTFSIEAWLPEGLADTGYDRDALELMSAEVTARSPGDWRKANMGAASPSSLPWTSRLRLGRLLVDVARAVAANVVDLGYEREARGEGRASEERPVMAAQVSAPLGSKRPSQRPTTRDIPSRSSPKPRLR